MSHIAFSIRTSTPAVVRDFLIARGVIKNENGELVGVRFGFEWLELPNPIMVTAAVGQPGDVGYIPPVYDTMRFFLLKFEHETRFHETEGEPDVDGEGNRRHIFLRTRIGKWVQANSTPYSYTTADGKALSGRRVTGQQVWLIDEDSTAKIANWQ